jgi:hypothetical protein
VSLCSVDLLEKLLRELLESLCWPIETEDLSDSISQWKTYSCLDGQVEFPKRSRQLLVDKMSNLIMKCRTVWMPSLLARRHTADLGFELPVEILDGQLPQFQILILTTQKRLQYLPLSITNLYHQYGVGTEVHVLVDRESASIDYLQKTFSKVHFHFDSNFYQSAKLSRFPQSRQSWFRQQTLKIDFAAKSDQPTLVIDSDTFILRPIDFLAEGKINLFIRDDVHWPYQHSLRRFIGLPYSRISFVTHFQLMSSWVIREIFGTNIEDGIDRWLESCLYPKQVSPLSEYQTIGQYLFQKCPSQVRLVTYSDVNHDLRMSTNVSREVLSFKGLYDVVTLARE